MIKKKNLKFDIINNLNINGYEIQCDWGLYKLIIFNLFQNSVKYNQKNGNIIIELSVQKINEKNVLVTSIEDSGKGIEEDRIKYLFNPMSELKDTQCL